MSLFVMLLYCTLYLIMFLIVVFDKFENNRIEAVAGQGLEGVDNNALQRNPPMLFEVFRDFFMN